jgi:glycosyltransferase involved in cell wall biosynthesis
LRIGFDARPLRHHWGRGVGQFWKGFLNHLLLEAKEDEFVFYLTEGATPSLYDLSPASGEAGSQGRISTHYSKRLREEMSWLWEQVTVSRYNRRDGIDVFHSMVQRSVPLCGGKNVVVHVFDMMPIVNAPIYVEKRGGNVGIKIRLYEKYLKQALPRVCRIIAISEQTKRDIIDIAGVEPNRVHVIYLALEKRFRKLEGAEEELRKLYGLSGRFLLYAGGIEYRKGCDLLLRAFQPIAQRNKELSLVMVGNAEGRYPEEIRSLTGELGLRDRVIFTGFVPDDHLPLFYNGAQIFVYPSTYEGFGLPVLEAMACGAPVITTSGTSIPEVAGDAARFFPTGDKDALIGEIEDLLANPDLSKELGERGIKRASEFTWARVVRQTRAVYQEVYRENR